MKINWLSLALAGSGGALLGLIIPNFVVCGVAAFLWGVLVAFVVGPVVEFKNQ